MSDPSTRKRTWLRTPRFRWMMLAGVVAVVVIAAIFVPRRTQFIVPVDRSARWSSDDAPPRREIVWSTADELPVELPAASTAAITPRFGETGSLLYFTARDRSGATDIFESRRQNDRWLPPIAVTAVNSEADDLAPIPNREGTRLYFASNRPGGLGGFDLYVAERTAEGWGAPRNLGAAVNSSADEYDPAPTADGTALYFASNRDPVAAAAGQQAESGRTEEPDWSATLRARRSATFDLFVAERAAEDQAWNAARALDEVNHPDSHEASPCVSPNGVFLYFASDRTVRPGEPRNLDLFRIRFDSLSSEPENLGTGVNTAAHETEPGLSVEGFTLVFASDRAGADRLYVSSAEEVLVETEWRSARLPAFSLFTVKLLLTALLTAGLIASILLYRRRLAEYFAASRYLLGSIAVHAVLLLLLAIWNLPRVLEVIVSRKFDAVPSTQLFDENQHQSHEEGPAAYEKLADLKALEPVPAPEVARQDVEPFNVPRRNDDPLPTIPLEVALRRPEREVLRVAPPAQAEMPRERSPALPVRRNAPAAAAVALAEPDLELPQPVESPEENAIASPELSVPRAQPRELAPLKADDRLMASLPVPRVETAAPASVTSAIPERPPSLPMNPLETRNLPDMPLSVVELDDALQLPTSPVPVPEAPLAAPLPVEIARAAATAPTPASPSTPAPLLATVPAPPALTMTEVRPSDRELTKTELPTVPGRLQISRELPPLTAASIPEETIIESPDGPNEPTDPLRDPIELAVARPAPSVAPPPTPDEMTGPNSRPERPLIVGSLSIESNQAPPAFGPIVTRLNRAPARATPVAIAVDSVGLRSMFTLRQADTRRQYIELFGGTDASEQAVNRGLEWLADHQNADGSWSLNRFHENCQHPACTGAGSESSNTAATGLALLPFLAAGHTHQEGPYQSVVSGGVRWLLEHQQENGDLLAAGDGQQMYSHGIAAIALCEAYGMTRDAELQGPAQRSVDFIVAAQNDASGGWRYKPEEHGDTSVVGWQVMALKSAEMAGLIVPASTHQGTLRWLESVEGNQPVGGQFGYQNRNATPAMSAEGLLCLQFLGVDRNDPAMRAGADYLLTQLPEPTQRHTSYYWYYGTQVVYHMQGDYFLKWNEAIRDLVVETQIKEGPLAGTWEPRDQWEHRGGRLYATSLKLLVLEIYYRHLPLYEQLGE